MATVSSPNGVRTVTWAWETLVTCMTREYAAKGLVFNPKTFESEWKSFVEDAEKERLKKY